MKSTEKGFTLIELLVVISIIAVLSSVVLASLNSARSKAADTAVKAAMKQVIIQAQNYLDAGNSNFGSSITNCSSGLFSDAKMTEIINNIASNDASGSNVRCTTDSTGQLFSVSVDTLKNSGTSWCIDNSQGWFKPYVTGNANGICY